MPTLIIDNLEISVAEGTNVLEAARARDIVIPHFCYHEALGAVGSCRLCAMMFLEGPVKGLHMACMVKAEDGMVVSSTHPEATDLRKHVIEWAMINHPHDCPVCDEGGECQLQEMTVAGGHGLRRYRGKKATFDVQDLGPFIQQEMNRCITCYRCVRTYRDYCGGSDYGVFGSRNRIFYGRFEEGRLESPFSGNIIDVCPTGVLTSKPFRFKTRLWDLQEAPSVCPHCSLGCSTVPGGRYREVQRVRAGIHHDTNGFFICDRGRFGYDHVNHPERPRQPKIDGEAVSIEEAISTAREKIALFANQYGPDSVAFLGSSRATIEANAQLRDWAGKIGTKQLVYEPHQERDRAARILTARLGRHARSLEELRHSDLVILIGVDPLAEGPILGLALRQAAQKGGQVVAIDPRPIELPCDFRHLVLPAEQLTASIETIGWEASHSFEPGVNDELQSLISELKQAENPIFVGGVDLLGGSGIEALCLAADRQSINEREVGLAALLGGPNSFGGALFSAESPLFDHLLDSIQQGHIKALVSLAADPFSEAMDPSRAQNALSHLSLLVSIDSTPSLAARRADIFIPSRTTAEMSGCMINNEGRLQSFAAVIDPGLPILETGQGNHPPREFFKDTPGSSPRPDWWIIAQLLERKAALGAVRETIASADQRFSELRSIKPGDAGVKIEGNGTLPPAADKEMMTSGTNVLSLLAISDRQGSEWLAHLSSPLSAATPEPYVFLHPDLAQRLALSQSDRAQLTTHLGHCSVEIQIRRSMIKDQVLAPKLWNTALEGLVPGRSCGCRLEKEITL